jgi:hypothetical protein
MANKICVCSSNVLIEAIDMVKVAKKREHPDSSDELPVGGGLMFPRR